MPKLSKGAAKKGRGEGINTKLALVMKSGKVIFHLCRLS